MGGGIADSRGMQLVSLLCASSVCDWSVVSIYRAPQMCQTLIGKEAAEKVLPSSVRKELIPPGFDEPEKMEDVAERVG